MFVHAGGGHLLDDIFFAGAALQALGDGLGHFFHSLLVFDFLRREYSFSGGRCNQWRVLRLVGLSPTLE